MHSFRQSSRVLRVFALVLVSLVSGVAAIAQQPSNVGLTSQVQSFDTPGNPSTTDKNRSSDPSSLKPAAEIAPTTWTAKPKSIANTDNAANDYKKGLNDLVSLYERDVQKLEQQNSQAKDLYRDGLIARVEMEKSDKDLADARAKVEEARNQLAAANKPTPIIAGSINSGTDPAWSTGNNRVDSLVRFYGNKYGVDPYLIYCLMSQESRFAANATSPKGAQGLMQLMPGTATRYGVTNPYDISQSIMGGTRYLKDLLEMFNGRVDLALAGYNAGENAVIKHGYSVPPYDETRNYVRLIIARYGKKRMVAVTSSPL